MKIYELCFDANNYLWLQPKKESDRTELTKNRIDKDWFSSKGVLLRDVWTDIEFSPIVEEGDQGKSLPDFCDNFIPVFSSRATSMLQRYLASTGELLPVVGLNIEYFAYNCTNIIDCLDKERSECRFFRSGKVMDIRKYVFRVDRITGEHIFKIPEMVTSIYISEEFHKITSELTGFKNRLIFEQ